MQRLAAGRLHSQRRFERQLTAGVDLAVTLDEDSVAPAGAGTNEPRCDAVAVQYDSIEPVASTQEAPMHALIVEYTILVALHVREGSIQQLLSIRQQRCDG